TKVLSGRQTTRPRSVSVPRALARSLRSEMWIFTICIMRPLGKERRMNSWRIIFYDWISPVTTAAGGTTFVNGCDRARQPISFYRVNQRSLLPLLVPIVDQIDTGDDIHDLAVGRREDSGVSRQEKTVRLVQVRAHVELRQRLSHDLRNGYH